MAFDTNGEARRLCGEMARANGVSDRVSVGGFLGADALAALPLGEKALIVSDCEGYEVELFNANTVACMRRHDLIIEMHDFVHLDASFRIRSLFADTHDLTVVESIDDTEKVRSYDYPELADLDPFLRRKAVEEPRPERMRWFVFRARNDASPGRASRTGGR